MIRLTDEQAVAAASDDLRINIVSVPGSGKTTVAAERFGYRRYSQRDSRGIIGLSFTRAAVGVLAARIRSRWGGGCLHLPHEVMTFDQLHVKLLEFLLRNSLVRWPYGHAALEVVDEYRGYKGFRWLTTASYRRYATLDAARNVVSAGKRVEIPRLGIGNVRHHTTILDEGISSHEDVRSVLDGALDHDDLWTILGQWLAANYREMIIDEVYDAAELDLQIAVMAMQAGLGVTLIGDPRQALYGWRGATPDKVSIVLAEGFRPYPLSRSFRFVGTQMPALADALRSGLAVTLPPVNSRDVDVALARNWRLLWTAGPNVLPLAFRSVANATDAVLNLLLDVVTRAHLEKTSFGREGAIIQLGLD